MAKLALRTQIVLALALSGLAAVACGGGEDDDSGGGGGSTSTGGATLTGGSTSTGGTVASGGTVATGGTAPGSGGSTAGGNPLCDGKSLALGSNPVIDDFEREGEPSSAIPANDGRVGYWYVYNDGTAGDATTRDQSPVETMEYPTADVGYDDGAGFATYAFGYSDYGAGFGVSLNNTGKTDCYVGASAAEGIEFWIKSGEPQAVDIDNSKLVVSIDMPSVIAEVDGGTCTTNCYDSHVAPITVTDSWQKIQLAWDDFDQEGWSGVDVPFNADLISKIAFKVPGNPGSYNVVIDDLAFYGEGSGAGGAGGDSSM